MARPHNSDLSSLRAILATSYVIGTCGLYQGITIIIAHFRLKFHIAKLTSSTPDVLMSQSDISNITTL